MLLEIILAQIAAWNSGDLNAFLDYYHDDVKVYSKPANDLVFDSKKAFLPHIQPDFEAGKVEKIKVIDQAETPAHVLLLEEKTDDRGTSRRAVVTYFLEGKKIKTMWIERVEPTLPRIPKAMIDSTNDCKSTFLGR